MNPTAATTEVTINGDTVFELAKGDEITVTTVTGEVIEGVFVSLTARGLRIHATPVGGTTRYITRKLSVVSDITLGIVTPEAPEADEPPAEDAAPATGEVTTFTDPAQPETDELDEELRALLLENSTEFGNGETQIEKWAAAEQAAPAPAAEVNEDAPAADYDTDPMVNGKHLSEMRFAEVMDLAKKYKTPGRGVARIDALRAGVALAISQEVARLAQG